MAAVTHMHSSPSVLALDLMRAASLLIVNFLGFTKDIAGSTYATLDQLATNVGGCFELHLPIK